MAIGFAEYVIQRRFLTTILFGILVIITILWNGQIVLGDELQHNGGWKCEGPIVKKQFKLYLSNSEIRNGSDCGFSELTPCSTPSDGFTNLKNLLQTDFDSLNATSTRTVYDIQVVIMTNFYTSCNLPLVFDEKYAKLVGIVEIDITFKSLKEDNRLELICVHSTDWIYRNSIAQQFLTSINLYNLKLANVAECFKNIENSDLGSSTIRCSPTTTSFGNLFITNSTLSASLNIHSINDIVLKDSTFSTSYNTIVENVNKLSCSNSTFRGLESCKILHLGEFDFDTVIFEVSETSLLNIFAVEKLSIRNSVFKRRYISTKSIVAIVGDVIMTSYISNCSSNGLSLLHFKNGFDVALNNLKITENINNRAVALENFLEVSMYNINMENNVGGAIYATLVSRLHIRDSLFNNNQVIGNGGALLLNATVIKINGCKFIENQASGLGGAITIFATSTILVDNSTFIRNHGTHSGGAIGTFGVTNQFTDPNIVSNSIFIGNSAFNIVEDIPICYSFDKCKGAGGALHFQSVLIEKNTFIDNKATWGGVLYLETITQRYSVNSTFINNTATFAGGVIFQQKPTYSNQGKNTFLGNKANGYGNDLACTIYNVEVTSLIFNMEGTNPTLADKDKPLQISFGQVVKLELKNMEDSVGHRIPVLKEDVTIDFLFDDDLFANIESTSDNSVTFYISSVSGKIREKSFFNLKFVSSGKLFTIEPQPCPSGWIISNETNGHNVCRRDFPYAEVITGSVIGGIIVLIVGMGLGSVLAVCAKNVITKLRVLSLREKAEQDMERKLLSSFNEMRHYDGSTNNVVKSVSDDLSTDIEKKISAFESNIINPKDLEFKKKIGSGSFGTIWLATCWGTTNVAVKSIHTQQDSDEEEFEREVYLLVKLRNPFIVTFYGVCLTENKKYMVVELMEQGSLDNLIYKSKLGKTLSFSQKLQILIDVSKGMKYLHGLKPSLVHRDLKPGNILINESGQAKVADFGLSKAIPLQTMISKKTNWYGGTLMYMAPEVILGDDDSISTTNQKTSTFTKIDVFSFAVIMWELFFEEPPYSNQGSEKLSMFSTQRNNDSNASTFNIIFKVAKEGLRPQIPFKNSQQLSQWSDKYFFKSSNNGEKQVYLDCIEKYMNLMKECWKEDPNERPSFTQILSDLITIQMEVTQQ